MARPSIKPERRKIPANITLDPRIKAKAIDLARRDGTTLSAIVSELLESLLADQATTSTT